MSRAHPFAGSRPLQTIQRHDRRRHLLVGMLYPGSHHLPRTGLGYLEQVSEVCCTRCTTETTSALASQWVQYSLVFSTQRVSRTSHFQWMSLLSFLQPLSGPLVQALSAYTSRISSSHDMAIPGQASSSHRAQAPLG